MNIFIVIFKYSFENFNFFEKFEKILKHKRTEKREKAGKINKKKRTNSLSPYEIIGITIERLSQRLRPKSSSSGTGYSSSDSTSKRSRETKNLGMDLPHEHQVARNYRPIAMLKKKKILENLCTTTSGRSRPHN